MRSFQTIRTDNLAKFDVYVDSYTKENKVLVIFSNFLKIPSKTALGHDFEYVTKDRCCIKIDLLGVFL